MKKHKLNLYPEITGEAFERLKQKLANGFDKTFPIIVYNNSILDGWNRYRACEELKIVPILKEFQGTEAEALEFVFKSNERRDLTASQRAVIALEYLPLIEAEAKKRQGKRNDINGNLCESVHRSSEIAAVKFGTNSHYVSDVKKISAENPEYIEQIKSGDISIQEAKQQIKKSEIVNNKKQNAVQIPDNEYEVIYCDPPWAYDTAQSSKAVGEHYRTMELDELINFGEQIKKISAKNCVLYMWATSARLDWAFPVIEAWGFKYKSSMIWDKIKHNMGFYSSVRHEILLIAGKGSCCPTDHKLANNIDSVQSIEKTNKHSEKPEEFRDIINSLYPERKKIELFARVKKDNWETWGNQI